MVKDCNLNTGIPDSEEGYSEEYILEDVDVLLSDQVQRVKKVNFNSVWENADAEGYVEVEDTYTLSTESTIQDAVKNIIPFLGLMPTEGSERVADGASTHTLLLSGIFRGGFEVLVRARLALSEGVTMHITTRSPNVDVSELITNAIGTWHLEKVNIIMVNEDKFIIDGGESLLMPDHKSYTRLLFESLKLGGLGIAQICLDTGESITFEQLLQKSVNMAVGLENINVRKGDVVAVCSENNFETSITILGTIFAGAIINTINPVYIEDELKHVLDLSKPKYVACSPSTAQKVTSLLPKLPYVKKIITYNNELLESSITFNSLLSTHVNVQTFELVPSSDQDVMVLSYSSGTTGLPKCVMLTQYNLMFQHYNYRDRLIVSETGTLFTIGPWYHLFGLFTTLNNIISHITTVFVAKFDQDRFLEGIKKHKINILVLVPPLMLFLAKSPKVEKYDLSSIKEIWCGAASLTQEVVELIKERTGVPCVGQAYGMTETSMAVLVDDSERKNTGSLGRLVRGMKAKIADLETGKTLGPYQNGELCFKGPSNMKGYLNNKEATEAMFDDDGFMHTGDIAYYDNDTFFHFVGRLKEIIKFKGFQVSPAEVEGVIQQHPGVRNCGVVGVPDSSAGELPLAFVVRQPDSNVTEKELVDFVASKLSATKHLRGGVRFIDEIPTLASGKILRRKLRELV